MVEAKSPMRGLVQGGIASCVAELGRNALRAARGDVDEG